MSSSNEHIKLKQYLEGKLSSEEAHAFEQEMADSDLLNDAVEGLQEFNNTLKIDDYVKELNKELKEFTSAKKKRRIDYKSQFNFWAIVAIIVIIALTVIAYFVLHKMHSS